jgi:hypothetical protein
MESPHLLVTAEDTHTIDRSQACNYLNNTLSLVWMLERSLIYACQLTSRARRLRQLSYIIVVFLTQCHQGDLLSAVVILIVTGHAEGRS